MDFVTKFSLIEIEQLLYISSQLYYCLSARKKIQTCSSVSAWIPGKDSRAHMFIVRERMVNESYTFH
jgi:hypothetical protein